MSEKTTSGTSKVSAKKAKTKTRSSVKQSAKQPKESVEQITIPKIDLKKVKITIEGMSPLMVNRFDEKCRQQIEDGYRGKPKNKTQPKSVEEEFEDSIYYMKKGRKPMYGMPASGVKNAAVSACRFVEGISMTAATGAFHVMEQQDGLVEIKTKKAPVMDERTVRVGNFPNKKPATRRRARFDDWSCVFDVTYNAGFMNTETLLNLFENAGFSIGLCEYRPEKKGNLGMFRVKRG